MSKLLTGTVYLTIPGDYSWLLCWMSGPEGSTVSVTSILHCQTLISSASHRPSRTLNQPDICFHFNIACISWIFSLFSVTQHFVFVESLFLFFLFFSTVTQFINGIIGNPFSAWSRDIKMQKGKERYRLDT